MLNPEAFAAEAGQPATLPASATTKGEFPLVEELDRLTGLGHEPRYISQSEFVSRLEGFAVLGPDRTPLAVGGDLTPAALTEILGQDGRQATLDAIDGGERGDRRLARPATSISASPSCRMENGKLARVYAFAVDQAAAAALTNVALTVVTLTTSLLIVMGFSVPAAIASRRIRERWLAERSTTIRYRRPGGDAEEVGLRSGAGLLLRQARRGRAGVRGPTANQPKVA